MKQIDIQNTCTQDDQLCKYRQAPCERLLDIFSPDKMIKRCHELLIKEYNGILCIMFRMNKNNSVHTDVKYEVYNMRKGNNVLCGIFHDYCKDFYNNHHTPRPNPVLKVKDLLGI